MRNLELILNKLLKDEKHQTRVWCFSSLSSLFKLKKKKMKMFFFWSSHVIWKQFCDIGCRKK